MPTDNLIDFNALGQALDTTWGRSSTPKTHGFSVKFSLSGNVLIASYAAIVNFGTEEEMIKMKRRYERESLDIISAIMSNVESSYKNISGGKRITTKEISSEVSIEIIGYGVHNPKRTAYYRRKTSFELA
jgi:hypothetical protein